MPPPLTYRSSLSRNLNATEGDNNIHNLDDRVSTLEGAVSSIGGGIAYFEVVADKFYVHLTDHTILGPYQLPSSDFVVRGPWQQVTIYAKNNIVTENGAAYLVQVTHTSALVFDPNATDGLGHNLYQKIMNIASPAVKTISGTTYTLTALDANCVLRFTNAAGCLVTLPPGVFAKSDVVRLTQAGTSAVHVVPVTPAQINRCMGFTETTLCEGATIWLRCVDSAGEFFDIGGKQGIGSP